MRFEMVSGDENLFAGAPDWALFVSKAQAGLYWEEEAKQVKGNKYQHTEWDTLDRYTGSGKMNKIIAERRPITDPESSAEWNGEGLPPVGCVCEFQAALGNWAAIRITAHGEDSMLMKQIGKDNEQYISKDNNFRPIRSPQDIAREEAIHAMASTPKPRGIPLYDICVEIYDAIAAGEIKGIKLEASK